VEALVFKAGKDKETRIPNSNIPQPSDVKENTSPQLGSYSGDSGTAFPGKWVLSGPFDEEKAR
jgi:hypothetical protein